MKKSVLLTVLLLGTAAIMAGPDDKPKQAAPAAQLSKPSTNAPTAATKPAKDFPIIGHIEKQGRVITIKAGPKGTLYSVRTTDGKVLHENVSEEQLRAQVPELHQFIKSAVAGYAGDARLEAPRKLDASVGGR